MRLSDFFEYFDKQDDGWITFEGVRGARGESSGSSVMR